MNCAGSNLVPPPFGLQVASNMNPAQFLKTWADFSGQVAAALSTNASNGALDRLISERVRGQVCYLILLRAVCEHHKIIVKDIHSP